MNGWSRFASAAACGALVATLAATPAMGEELSPAGERAMARVAACAANADHLLVSIVVDESGSLRETDPGDQRVDGINSAIDALADLRAEADGALEIEVSLAVFAEGYSLLESWLALDDGNAQKLRSISSDKLPTRDAGRYTDYRAALNGSKAALDEREAELGDSSSCKVLLWFTDGAPDVAGDEDAAMNDLCMVNGIADSLRSSQITVIALALFHEQSTVTAEQREQLRAVAEGEGEGVTCGQTPIASDAAGGAYLRADDANTLRRVFAGVGALIRGGSRSQSIQCPSSECADGILHFPVDQGIAGFQLIVDSPDDSARLTLTDPDGDELSLTVGARSTATGQLDVTAREGLTTASLTFDDVSGPQVGQWRLAALSDGGEPSPVALDLYYRWGASLVIEAPERVTLGEASPVTARVLIGEQSVSPDWYEQLDVELLIGETPVSLTQEADHLVGSVELPSDGAPSEVTMAGSAVAWSSPSGIRLAPISTTAVFATRLPASYPTIDPTRLVIPTMTTTEGASGVLSVTGGERDTTTACLQDAALVGPEGAGTLSMKADATCIEMEPGESRDWTFTLATDQLADGRVAGDLHLVLTGADPGDTVTMTVPVSSTMTRPVDEPLRWALVAGLVLLSLLVPLLLLAIGNWWIGRFRFTHLSRAASVPVLVSESGVRARRQEQSTQLIDPDDFSPVGQGEVRRRSFSVQGVDFAHALPLWPMGEPSAHATTGSSEMVASGTGIYTDAEARRAPVTTALEQSWVLVVDADSMGEEEDEVPGRIVFVNEDTGLREIIESRTERLVVFPGWDIVWSKLQAAAKQRRASARAAQPRSTSAAPSTAPSQAGPPGGSGLDADGPDAGPPLSAAWDDEPTPPPPPGAWGGGAQVASGTVAGRRGRVFWAARRSRSKGSRAQEVPRLDASGDTATDRPSPDDELPPPPISF